MTGIAIRLDSESVLSEERDIRVDDYLNDKLQIDADLENLDSLLLNVKSQQTLLRKQLVDAEADLEKAQQASESHASSVLQQADSFTRRQADIERKILIITRSETSDDAIHRFNSSMEKLRRLDIAQGYVELLAEVDKLSADARRNFKTSPQAALQPYVQLQNLAKAVKAAQPAAEGAAPHLVDYVENSATVLWKHMKDAFGAEFEETLVRMKWPGKDVTSEGLETEWTEGVVKLLELQEPELRSRERQETDGLRGEDPLVLLPLEVMVKPLELRFRYHFDGDRPTNRPDKPEYFLSHVIGLLNTYNDLFAVYLQPILNDYFKGSDLALNPTCNDSTSAFITSLLPMVRHKVFSLLPQLVHQPQLLSHLIHELMSFDTTLKDEWAYDGVYGLDAWKGLAWEVLVKRDWFGKWLQVEKEFALSRYQNILDAKDSRELDYDSVDPGTTKPTKAAIRVNDLLETITDRYRPLSSFSQKLRFLIDIQITIFDKFHDRLQSSLEAYLTLTSPIARTMQGIRQDDQTNVQGVEGMERLCRVYGSAEYMEKKMRDWSDDIFFLELWDELQDRARHNTTKNLAGPMSIEDVAERTSSHVGSEGDSGALFDETADAYRRLRVRTEGIIQDTLIHDMRDALRPYGRINPWSSLSPDDSNAASLGITAELDALLQQLTLYLNFLAAVLATAPLRRIARQLSLSIQAFFWDNILMWNTFSASGAVQLSRDLAAIWGVFDKYLGPGQGATGMKKLKEGVGLLNLPMHSTEEANEAAIDLLEVEQKVFESNESAREVLQALGLEVVSESEARHVLERRVELGRSTPRIQGSNSTVARMAASHSNLHFVNLSKPNEGKDEETRRAVRTHVMRQYIQKKRVREKRKAARKTQLEGPPHFPCTCPTSQAVPQTCGTSSGWPASGFGTCPTCDGRRWAMADTESDRGGGWSMTQAVTQYSSLGRRHNHPVTVLGAGRVDPFGVYPVEAQPYMHDLLDHYFVLLGQALIPAKVTGQHSPFLTKWMRLALRCPALFYGTLLVSSTHYTATRVDKRDETWVLVNRGQAIQALNKALADSDQAISDENIAAVINLAGHELLVGNLPFYTCHMIGLEKMVAMRGGLHTLGLDGLTEALAHWVDQMGVALTGSTPRFPLAPIPTLVPQAKPAGLGLGPPTPPLTTSPEISSTEVIEANQPQPVGGYDGAKRPTVSRFSDPTPYPPCTAADAPTDTVPQPVTSLPINSTISSLPAHDPLSLLPSESPGRDEDTDMFEVGRFVSIVYPKRRWKGFTNNVGTQPPPQQAPECLP